MVSKNNFRNKLESEAKRVPHYGLRKLNIGVASVLLGAGLYFAMPANVHADVPANTNQPTNTTEEVSSVANSAASSTAASEATTSATSSAATKSLTSTASSSSSNAATVTSSSASKTANSTANSAKSSAAGSVASKATSVATSTAADTSSSAASTSATSQATSSIATKSTSAASSSVASQNSSTASQANSQAASSAASSAVSSAASSSASSTSSSAASSSSATATLNVSSLASNATSAGSLDPSLFQAGTLDLTHWTTTVQDGYLMLTGYTGDKAHIVIPNEADFENAGLDPQHLQVGITRDVVRSIQSSATQSFEFSNTAGQKVKAIGDDWSTAFTGTSMPNLQVFDGSGLDTSGIADFENMFNGVKLNDAGLATLQNWDTSNATSMMNMFIGGTFSDLTPLSNWDTSKVRNMFNMFRQCANLSDLTPIAHWNTSSLTDLGLAFGDDQQLTTADLSHWDLSKVTNFGGTFADTNPKIIVLVNNESVRSAIQSGINGTNAITIGSDKVAMPNVYVINSTTTAHQAIVNAINQALTNYRSTHSDVHNLVPEQPLASITNLQDLANVTFRNGISVTYQFVDDDNHESNVGSAVTVAGNAGDHLSTGLTIPAGYVLAAGETLPTTVTIGNTNSIVHIHLVHAITVSYQFVDDNETGAHVGAPITVSGAAGSTQSVSLTVPTNYALATGQTLPTNVTIGNSNTVVDIHLVHTYEYFASGPTETRIITHHWVYGDGPHAGEQAAPDSVIEIYLTHMSRRDKVTGQVQNDLPYVVNGTTYLGDNTDMSYNFASRWWPDASKGDSDTPGVHVVSGQWNARENYQYAMAHPDAMRSEREGGNTWDETDLVAEAPNLPGYTIVHSQVGRSDGLENNRYVSPWTQITNWREEGWTAAWAHSGEKSNEDTTLVYQGVTNTYEVVDDSEGGRILSTQTLSGSPGSTINFGRTDLRFTIPTGYEVAPGTTWPTADTTITFGDAGQLIVYHLQHQMRNVSHTSPITPGSTTITNQPINGAHQSDLNKTVTRTINVTAPDGTITTNHQTVDLYRDAKVDEVTGDVTYDDWNTGNWDAYTVPTIAGYTPSQASVTSQAVDSTTSDATVNITYSANEHTTQIKYVDADGNAIKTDSISGNTGQTVTVNSAVPAGWQINSGTVPATITFSDNGYPDVTIQIAHQIDTVTHDHPLDPNATTPTNQPINGAHQNDLNRNVTRTIKVTAPDGISRTTVQAVHLFRNAKVDEVTGYVTYGDWNTGNWDEFDVPTYAGYTPTQTSVSAQAVNSATVNAAIDITYTPNAQTAHIIYVDHDGHQIKSDTITGHTNETMNVNPVAPAGWQIVSGQTIPSTITFSATGHPDVIVRIEHITETVMHDHPLAPGAKTPTNVTINGAHEADLNKTVTRTINVTDPTTGQTSTTTQQAHIYRDATVDEVTGDVTYGDWSNGNWAAFTIPAVDGYTPSQSNVVSQTVTGDTTDQTVDITYQANDQTTHIIYEDPANTVVKTDTVSGKTGQTVNTNSTVPTGWKLVNGQTVPTTITFSGASTPDTVVHIEHDTTQVSHNSPVPEDGKTPTGQTIEGAHDADLNHTIIRTINVTAPDGHRTSTVQRATIHRDATYDDVTGEVTYGAWSTDSTSWTEFTPATVAGYTVSQPDVPAVVVKDGQALVTVNITYTPNVQTGEIQYVDGTTVVGTTPLNGHTDESITVTPVIPDHYTEAPGQTIPTTVTATAHGIPTVTIYVQHSTNDLHDSKTVTRTINVTDQHGHTNTTTQIVTLTREGTHDAVTDTDSWGDWTTGMWDAFTVPTIPGYTPSQASVASQAVNPKTENATVNITYTANNQTGKISYLDVDNGNTEVGYTTLNGQTDADVTVHPVIPEHFVEVPGQNIPRTVKATADGIPTVRVYVCHDTHSVSDSKDVTRTIKVTNPDGTVTTTPQIAHLMRTGTHDEVTGHDSWNPWTNGTWAAFDTPAIAGYTPTVAHVDSQNVDSNTKDTEVDITYTANDQSVAYSFVDDDNEDSVVAHGTLSGTTGQTINTGLSVPANYRLATGQTVPTTYKFAANDNHPIVIHLKHQTKAINGSETITRTINVTNPSGRTTTITQRATLTRTGTHDDVTNTDTWSAWSTGSWDAFTTPTITGYTPSQASVTAQTVTSDMKDTTVNIIYTANDQSVAYSFVDDDDGGRVVVHGTLSGTTGQTINTGLSVPANYQLATGQTIPTTYKFAASDNQPIVIHLKHQTESINDSKTITRTINVTKPSGRTTTITQRATLTRTGTHDDVTNTDTWSAWSTGNWPEFNVPTIAGYTPSQARVPAQAVTSDTPNTTVNITYNVNDQSITIRFVDDTDPSRAIAPVVIHGHTGETVSLNPALPTGYELAPGESLPISYTFTVANDQSQTIHLVHGHHSSSETKTVTRRIIEHLPGRAPRVINQTVTLTRRNTTDAVTGTVTSYGTWSTGSWSAFTPDAVPDYTADPATISAKEVTGDSTDQTIDVNYVANTRDVSQTKTVTETIHYRYSDGSQAAPDKVQTVTFTRHGSQHADGSVAWQAWQPTGSQVLPAVDSPTIDGYHPDQASIPAQTVSESSQDLTFTVTYVANTTPVNPDDHDHGHHTNPDNPNDHGNHSNPDNPNDHGNHSNPDNPNDHGNHNSGTDQDHDHQTPGTNPDHSNQNNPGTNISGQPNGHGQSNPGNAQSNLNGQTGQLNGNATSTGNQQGQQRLPQTGNQNNDGAILGLAGIALTSMLGLLGYRKKDNY